MGARAWISATHAKLLRSPRGRVVLGFADQVVSSTSNFITGVAIARFSGAVEFGQYALVLTIWLVVVGIHRRVITEPLVMESQDADIGATAVAHGLSAELLLGSAAAALTAGIGLLSLAVGAHIGVLLLVISAWFVPLLVQDYWRMIAYQLRRPDLALVNDTAFALVQLAAIAGFALAGWHTGAHMITAWGLGAACGAVVGFSWFPARAGWGDGWRLLRRLWPRGRWLFTDFVISLALQQGYLVLAALLLSQVDYGGLRAGFSLMGPTIVILLAAGNIGLPEAARRAAGPDRELHRYVRQLSWWISCCVGLYGLALVLGARPILRVLYGSEFVRYAPLVFLAALQYLVVVSMYGQGIALRATNRIRQLWPARVGIFAASLVTTVLLFRWLGLAGVGWAGVATGAYDAVAVYLVYRSSMRSPPGPPLLPSTADPLAPRPTGGA